MFWLLVFINFIFVFGDDSKGFMDEWSKNMKGYIADDQLSFTIEGNSEEVFSNLI